MSKAYDSDETGREMVQDIVAAVEKAPTSAHDDEITFTTTSGYLVKVGKIPDMFLRMLKRRYKEPSPPLIDITSGGKTWQEENLGDEEYLEALRKFAIDTAETALRLMALFATKILSAPDVSVTFENDKEFRAMFTYAFDDHQKEGLDETALRYEWLRHRVFPQQQDIMDLMEAHNRAMGFSEEDIAAADDTFLVALRRDAPEEVDEDERGTGESISEGNSEQ